MFLDYPRFCARGISLFQRAGTLEVLLDDLGAELAIWNGSLAVLSVKNFPKSSIGKIQDQNGTTFHFLKVRSERFRTEPKKLP